MPDSDSKSKSPPASNPPSAEESGVTDPASKAETEAGWDDLVGDSEEMTAPVSPPGKPPVAARPPAGLFTPSIPGASGSGTGPKLPPAPTLPAAPPVPGIKPAPLFTPVNVPTKSKLASDADADEADDADETDDAKGDFAPDDAESEADDDESDATDRAPVRLPTPGVWGKQAPHDAVIDFVRREDAADFFSKASASAADDEGGEAHAPEAIKSEDTQALIASMAEEIEEVAEAQKAAEEAERARKAKEAALLEQPTIVYDKSKRKSEESDSKKGWIGIAAAALAGVVLIGWSMAGGDDEGGEATQTETAEPAAAVAAAERPEPSQAAEQVEEAEPEPEPAPEVAEGETEGEEAAEETGEEVEELVEEPEPEPEPEPAPTGNNKPRGPTKKSGPSKQTTNTSKSEQTGPSASSKPKPPPSKSAADLLRDAKKANAAGQASKAYSLANQSYQAKASSGAAEIMVLAACKMKNTGKARSALNKVKLLKRRDLKQRCKSMGVKL